MDAMRYQLILLALLWATPGSVAAREVGVSVGASYSTGRYGGTEPVKIGSTYFGLNTSVGNWRVDATLPYLIIGTGGATVDAGGIVLPGEGRQNISGFGDLTLRATGPVSFGENMPFDVRIALQSKVPTGEAGLSTRKFDGGIDVEVSKSLGSISPFLTAGYRTYGDSRDLELRDGWALSAGSTLTLGKTTLIGSYDWVQSAVDGPASHELYGIAAGEISPKWGWTVFGSKGLSSGAADFMLGLGITRTFGKAPAKAISPKRRL